MSFLGNSLSKKTSILGLKLWVDIVIAVGLGILLILFILSIWLLSRKGRKSRKEVYKLPLTGIPDDSKEIKEVKIDRVGNTYLPPPDGILLTISENSGEKDSTEKMVLHLGFNPKDEPEKYLQHSKKEGQAEKLYLQGNELINDECSHGGSHRNFGKGLESHQEGSQGGTQYSHIAQGGDPQGGSDGERRALLAAETPDRGSNLSADGRTLETPSKTEVSFLGWGHWYTLRELEAATDGFAEVNVLGEGGYGIVYRGQLTDGTLVAVKKLLNNRGQAEKEFRVEVDAIGRVRHKNLVRLLGYCAEGAQHRMLVYEYVDNGNLEQWLHGPIATSNALTWEARMKIVMGTAKGLTYLHEALEPKVVHRDIKSSNILVDGQWNAKVSDFGLAKLLGSGKSHVTTRVMGTFGYVAPEYANTGLLNERSDVYSFGVLLMELITGRDPVDYSRPAGEVNLVDWLKMMVGNRMSEEVADPNLDLKPTSRALKRALLVALRCVDPDSSKRPKMGQVVHMLEAEDFPFKDDRRVSRDSRSRRTDTINQERILQSLSVKDTSAPKPADEESDNSVESPCHLSYVKKYRKYES